MKTEEESESLRTEARNPLGRARVPGLDDPLKYSSRRYVKRTQRGPRTKEGGGGRGAGDGD